MSPHTPRKRFGQHFLHDKTVIQRIVDSLNIMPDEHWIEIGPGQAALTDLLIDRPKLLTLIEIDRDLAGQLSHRYQDKANLTIINQDVLEIDFSALTNRNKKISLVGNLPYNISTPIFFQLAKYADSIDQMTFMIQKEVADRLLADANSKTYGRLSLSAGLRFKTTRLFNVGKGAFNPPPKVESTVIKMVPHAQQTEANLAAKFDEVVKAAFLKRRKTLRNSLANLLDESQIIASGVEPKQRAENLTIQDYLKLAQQVL